MLNCEHRVPQFECPGASEREHLTQTTWFLTHAVVCPFTLQWPHWHSCTHPRGELQNISMILLPVTPAQCRAYRQSRVHADEHPLSADGQLLEGQGKGLSCGPYCGASSRFTALQHQLLPFMSFCFSVLMPSVMKLVKANVTPSLSVSKHKTKSSQLVELKVKMTEKRNGTAI